MYMHYTHTLYKLAILYTTHTHYMYIYILT